MTTPEDYEARFGVLVSENHRLVQQIDTLTRENDSLKSEIRALHELVSTMRTMVTHALTYIDSHLGRQ